MFDLNPRILIEIKQININSEGNSCAESHTQGELHIVEFTLHSEECSDLVVDEEERPSLKKAHQIIDHDQEEAGN